MSDDIKWERGDSGFDMTLLKYSIRRLVPLGQGPNVLDAGCNDGLFTKELYKNYEHVIGIDSSPAHVVKARQNVPDAEFHVVQIEDYIPSELLDSIYMLNVLEHVINPIGILKRMRDWLKPGGCIIIQVPNALSMNRRIGQRMQLISNVYSLSPSDTEVGHSRFYDSVSLRQDVIDSGLVVELSGSIFLKPLANPQMRYFVDHCLETDDLRAKFCDACFDMAAELPDYSSPIWVKCTK